MGADLELTAFIDALVCFDRLYCIANPIIDISHFNRRLGANVLTAIPDPDGGMLRRLAVQAAASGVSEMWSLRVQAGPDDSWGQEVQAVVDGWRAVLGPDIPSDGPFDIDGVDIRLAETGAPAASSDVDETPSASYDPQDDLSAVLIDGAAASSESAINSRHRQLRISGARLRVITGQLVPADVPPAGGSSRRAARALRCQVRAWQGDWEQAVSELEDLHNAYPYDGYTLLESSLLQLAQHHYRAAIEAAEKAAHVYRIDSCPLQLRAAALAHTRGLDDAQSVIEEGLRRFPDSGGLRTQRGWVNFARREFTQRSGRL